jgi:hypothetical protein
MFYAVKRIKKKISSESEGRLVVKESCALASLISCPYMIRYFGCWIDDGHLHIQTEYCDKGSMDCFVVNSNVRNSDPLIPDHRNLNIDIDRNEGDDDMQVNHDNDNVINHENEKNNDNNNHNYDNDDNRNMKISDEIFTEKSNNTNFNEKQLFSVYENSQNDSLFDSQKDEIENNDEKENTEFQENTLKYNSNVNNHYSNNNDDNDDELFIKEDNYNDNQNMDINIAGIDISKIVKNNEFYSDIDKENKRDNNNENKILSVCENDAQLRYSDAIFSAEEDSRNSDTYSCFSESNSNNYYDLKYNNKHEEFQNDNEVENSNYENQILRDNKNNKQTINQEKRISKTFESDTLQNKDKEKNENKKVIGEGNRREIENDDQDNYDRGMIEVEKGRTREGVRGGEGGQEEENRNVDNEMPIGVVSEGLVWGILHSMGSALQYMHSRGTVLMCVCSGVLCCIV